MCKNNLGNCSCGCNSCSTKAATIKPIAPPTVTQTPTIQSSGYSKKSTSSYFTNNNGSGYSKKSDYSVNPLPMVADEILEPEVEVLEPTTVLEKADDYTGIIAAGIGLASLFLIAGYREKKKKENRLQGAKEK